MCSFWRENSNTFSCFENACSSLHSQNCSMRLIEWFSNTVNFVFATSMLPYSVQCAKTNMSYRNRNTTAFCSRRTTMVTRIFFAVVIVVTSYESPFQNVLSCFDNLFVRTLERYQSGSPLFLFDSYPKMGLCSIRFFFQYSSFRFYESSQEKPIFSDKKYCKLEKG